MPITCIGRFTLALMSALVLLPCGCGDRSGRSLDVVRGTTHRGTQTSVYDVRPQTADLAEAGADSGNRHRDPSRVDPRGSDLQGRADTGAETEEAETKPAHSEAAGGSEGGASNDTISNFKGGAPSNDGIGGAPSNHASAGAGEDSERDNGEENGEAGSEGGVGGADEGEAGGPHALDGLGGAAGIARSGVIHVFANAELEGANGTEQSPYPTLADAVAFIASTEASDTPWDGRIIVHEGRYEVQATVELPPSADIEFLAGVTMAMGADVSLHANRNAKVLGTEAAPVLFTWLVEDEPWGCFTVFVPESHDNEFYYATFEHGGQVTYEDISVRGALSLEGASGHISHCTFQDNAGDDGLSLGNASALVDYCTFLNNSGDGLDADGASGAEIAHCYFDGNGNDALDTGEGADLWAHDNTILNSADTGVEIGEASTVRIDHNIIVGNHIGIGIRDDADPVTSNNTVYGNAFGIAGYHFKADWGYGKGVVTNTIVSGSSLADVALLPGATTVFSYSCIPSGTYVVSVEDDALEGDIFPLEGEGLLSKDAGCDDPLFVNPSELDFHLVSTAGHPGATAATWVTDDATSPCIDSGNPDTDLGEETEPNGGRVDMGAYGGTAEASHSP